MASSSFRPSNLFEIGHFFKENLRKLISPCGDATIRELDKTASSETDLLFSPFHGFHLVKLQVSDHFGRLLGARRIVANFVDPAPLYINVFVVVIEIWMYPKKLPGLGCQRYRRLYVSISQIPSGFNKIASPAGQKQIYWRKTPFPIVFLGLVEEMLNVFIRISTLAQDFSPTVIAASILLFSQRCAELLFDRAKFFVRPSNGSTMVCTYWLFVNPLLQDRAMLWR